MQSSDEIGELNSFVQLHGAPFEKHGRRGARRRDKLNTLLLHMTDGVAAFTTDGTLIHMNPATENLLGV